MRVSLPNMRYLAFEHNKGSNIALSEGIRISRGDYLLFTDDDCVPHFDWVNQMIAALDRAAIVAGMIVSPTSDFLKLCHNISEFHLFFPGNQSRFVDFVAGANMGFRRDVYDVIGGLSKTERLAHDMDMILRARTRGYRICRARESFVLHDPDRNSLRTIFRYTSKHAENTIVLRNLYRRTLKTPFVLRSPLLILLASPIIAFWVTLGIYLRNPPNLALWKTIPIVGALKLTWCWGAAYGLSRFSCRDSSTGENGR
jgi:GT2 family glycosyltransferase